MKIGFYFDFAHLVDFDLEQFSKGERGVSGTDSSLFRVVDGLVKRGMEVRLLAKGSVVSPLVEVVQVDSFTEAVQFAINEGYNKLVVVYKETKDIENGIALANQSSLRLVIWAQNPVSNAYLSIFENASSIAHLVFVEQYDANHTRHKKAFCKSLVIPNGIEKEIYVTKEIKLPVSKTVCFLGSLTYSKGFHLLAEAWPKVRAEVPGAQLIILGSGKLYNNRAKLGPLGLADDVYEKEHIMPYLGNNVEELKEKGVIVRGLVTRNELLDILPECSIVCINPNTYGSLESCSVSSLETQMLGIPVVAGKAGGNLCTIIDGVTGFLVVPSQLHLPIIRLLSDDQLNRRLRVNARQNALSKYELHLVLDKWTKLLQDSSDFAGMKPVLSTNILDKRLFAKELIRLATFNRKLI